jgi:hypothetical protein
MQKVNLCHQEGPSESNHPGLINPFYSVSVPSRGYDGNSDVFGFVVCATYRYGTYVQLQHVTNQIYVIEDSLYVGTTC